MFSLPFVTSSPPHRNLHLPRNPPASLSLPSPELAIILQERRDNFLLHDKVEKLEKQYDEMLNNDGGKKKNVGTLATVRSSNELRDTRPG